MALWGLESIFSERAEAASQHVRTTMFSQMLDISKALYHDVRHAE
jgi:hypothetical protein